MNSSDHSIAADAGSARGDDYESLPYPSLPFPDTQPAHLAAVAALFGIAAADPRRARVLELGCAAGGNIIPLAIRFPDARFLGLDLARRHVEDGTARLTALQLGNVMIRQADLATLELGEERFDYILCNGLYSWVPDAVKEAILRLCGRALAANGVAAISYNVLPGWRLRMVVRDICLRHSDPGDPARVRVAKARQALERLAAVAASDPYGALLRQEAARLRAVPDAYIAGEFLAVENTPVFVTEFAARAEAGGLRYLCETDLCAAVPPDLDPALRQELHRFGADRPAVEQLGDFLTGRPFRRSILLPSSALTGTATSPAAERLLDMHLSSALRPDEARTDATQAVFVDSRLGPVTAKLPSLQGALQALAAAFPATVPVRDLLGAAPDAPTRSRLASALLELVLAGRASLSACALQVGRARDERPSAWPLARSEAASGQPWLTTLRHDAVPAGPLERAIVPALDGTLDRTALIARVASGLADGTIWQRTDAAPTAEALLDQLLAQLERQALLQATAQG